jgi:uncharacterized protein YndB with AHSA1/START domain
VTEFISVQTTVRAALGHVWACFTRAEHITQWNFASDEWHCPRALNDATTGGAFNWRMEARDGSAGFDFEGTYDEVVPEKSLAYRLGDGRKVEIRFEADGDFVQVVESFEPEGTNADEMQRAGWQAILNNFKKHAET